jgi:hypothetical protein
MRRVDRRPRYARGVRAAPLFPLLFLIASLPVLVLPACEPRKKEAVAPTASPTPPPPPPPSAKPSATTPATVWTIPGLNIPGLPVSPKQALIGKWNVAAIDGKPIATAPGMATDPMDPSSYAAGSGVVFTADTVTVTRAGATIYSRPYKVLSEQAPVRVTIDSGYGPSNVDFALDGSAVWSLPSTPPHALSLTRAQ